MSLNSVNFDYNQCSFQDDKNNVAEKNGLSRDGSGRAAIFKETALPNCFTLEANFCTGLKINTL